MTETRSQNFTAIHRSSVKFRGGICRFKTFCMRIFARKTFLRLRCSSIHIKMRVVLTYFAIVRKAFHRPRPKIHGHLLNIFRLSLWSCYEFFLFTISTRGSGSLQVLILQFNSRLLLLSSLVSLVFFFLFV